MVRLSNLTTKASLYAYFLFILASMGLTTSALFADTQSSSDHVGTITAEQLLTHYPQFKTEYLAYKPTDDEIEKMSALKDKEVTVLFGTWCHDSEREVPRLLKLLDSSGIELTSLTLFGVDRKKDDPDGVAQSYDLKYTPTLIVSSQGEEIARIIEKPKDNLAADFAEQLSDN